MCLRLVSDVEEGLSEVSVSAANVANNGKHLLLEFDMRYFREGQEKFDQEDQHNESLKDKKKAKKKKSSGANEADWTWKDRIDMVKWTDRMITVNFENASIKFSNLLSISFNFIPICKLITSYFDLKPFLFLNSTHYSGLKGQT